MYNESLLFIEHSTSICNHITIIFHQLNSCNVNRDICISEPFLNFTIDFTDFAHVQQQHSLTIFRSHKNDSSVECNVHTLCIRLAMSSNDQDESQIELFDDSSRLSFLIHPPIKILNVYRCRENREHLKHKNTHKTHTHKCLSNTKT